MGMPLQRRVLLGEGPASRRCEGTTTPAAVPVDSSNRRSSDMLLAAAARPREARPSHPALFLPQRRLQHRCSRGKRGFERLSVCPLISMFIYPVHPRRSPSSKP